MVVGIESSFLVQDLVSIKFLDCDEIPNAVGLINKNVAV